MARKMTMGASLGLAALGVFVLWKMASGAPPAPDPKPGQTSQEYMDEVEAWGMQTGQMYPTMMGYGQPGMDAGAKDAWYARPIGNYTPGGLFYPGMP